MLMKDKSGSMPAFLLGGSSSDEKEEGGRDR